MTANPLKSIDLYLEYPAGAVVAVDGIVDVGAGMYPVYYYQRGDDVLVSTSVTELVFELGWFERNSEFDPPDFLALSERESVLGRLLPLIPDVVRAPIPPTVAGRLREVGLLGRPKAYYTQRDTADRRVFVLRPFERVTPDERTQSFEPTYELDDPDEFAERSAREIRTFVNAIERRFPDHHHVVLVGGRDSQLLTLVPKRSPENWHVFSAEPNYPIVEEFLSRNDVQVGRLFRHDNRNEETPREFRRKVICSDLRSSPRHLRWYPTLERIVDGFDGNCIFWFGAAGDAFNTFSHYHVQGDFFRKHFERAGPWLGTYHQVMKNYTGAPALSPYHSESIWETLYRIHDPEMLSPGMDLRPAIASQWHDRELWWSEQNPRPEMYEYDEFGPGYHREYYEYIEACLDGEADSVIRGDGPTRQSHPDVES